ncbi:mechanosensitive ion channel protein MscS [Kordiimonas sediminis]|uniref:Mechanosensitive ion channel protein MscS n=1 Tax=Kordiimonas sediminis TaxID=1735581 RepID=A0A919AZ65_9PROT|nr:mechanosensitive ion channel family protein [Kordiimonas sediminis]GHF30557.1 mechanosensitive ion channel protein MscS [Kordiimonas sediminis]
MSELQEFFALVKDVWQNGVYGYDIGEILIAIIIFLGFIIFRRVFTYIVINRVKGWASRTKTDVDDAIIDAVEAPINFIPIVMGIFFGTSYLTLDAAGDQFVANINRSLIVFTIFWGLVRASSPVSELLEKADSFLTGAMITWLSKAIRIAFVLLGAATILEIWGIEVGPLIAGFGLFGVAVALGAQDLFKNLIAGLFVIGEKRFHAGDWILVEGIVEGTVEHIGFRTTTIIRFDKSPVYVPNAKLSDNAVTNFSRMSMRRIKWVIGLRYDSTAAMLQTVRDGIETYLTDNPKYAQPSDTSTFVRIDSFGSSSINILLYCFTKTTDWLEWLAIKEELLLEIKKIVEDAGTDFAFPSQSLYLEAIPGGMDPAPIPGNSPTMLETKE